MPLFRDVAVDFHRQHRHWGTPVAVLSVSTQVCTWVLVGTFVLLGVFVVVAPYARKETVAGYLTLDVGSARVVVPEPGLVRVVHVREGQLVTVGAPLLTIEPHGASASGRQAYLLRASVAGRVTTLVATAGQWVDARQPQLAILPAPAILQAALLVPTRAAGFVQVGQDVRLKVAAFPYQHFGTVPATVVRVSGTMLRDHETSGPLTVTEPAYLVTVRLDAPTSTAGGMEMALQADMLLMADLILEQRTLLQWVLDPLRRVQRSAT